nr:MAG TPA: inhibitor of dorsal protein [Caudoviricetes sp.]
MFCSSLSWSGRVDECRDHHFRHPRWNCLGLLR